MMRKKTKLNDFMHLQATHELYMANIIQNKPMLGDYADTFSLPVPKNMDVAKIAKTFETKMK